MHRCTDVSQWPVTMLMIASVLEFVDKILIFAVLKCWLLQLRFTDSSSVLQYLQFYEVKQEDWNF